MAQVALLVGFDVARGTWATNNAIVGPGATHRIFYSGSLPTSFDADGTPTSVTCIVSYKTQNTNVASYVNSIPNNRNVILIYHHEPEGDYTLGSTFVAEFKTQSNLIQAQSRYDGTTVRVAMCSAGYPYRAAGSSDVLAGNYLKGLGPYVDLFTKDIYQGSAGVGGFDWPSNGLANYPQWTNWLNLVTNPTIVGTVQPLGITEYGVDDPVGDSARNTRIQLDGTYLTSAFTPGGASAVSPYPLQLWCYWYQDLPAPDPNQAKFTDSATITTWQGYETAAPAATGAYLIGQTNAAGGTTTLVVSVSSATNAGDIIVVNTDASSGTVSGVTDSKGNTYTQRNSDTGAVGTNLYQFSADGSNNAGGTMKLTTSDTITITFSASSATKCAVVAGVSGMSSSPIDSPGTVSADSAGSAAPSATTGTLAVSGEVIIAAEGNGNGGGAISWTGSWTQLGATQHNGSGQWLSVVFQVAPSTTAVTASGTITSTKWTVETLALKPVGTVVTPGSLISEVDLNLNVQAVLGTPVPQPVPGGGATPAPFRPQIFVEAGLVAAAPVAPPGTLILDDPVNGKLDTARVGDSTVWSDITAFLKGGTITRPSSRVQGPLRTYEAGTASAVLDNSDGRFDPDNPNSPYQIGGVSTIRPMVPLRVRTVFAGIEYALFNGFADAWQETGVTFDAGWGEVEVSASDGFKVLAGRNLPELADRAGIGELSGSRVNRIASAAGWFTDHREIAAGDSGLQGTTYGAAAYDLMQLAADSEVGELYIDGSGNLTFRNRHAILTETRSTIPQAVFGDAPFDPISLTSPDNDFETGTGHWNAAGNSTISQSVLAAYTGTGSLRIRSNAAGSMQAGSCNPAAILALGKQVRQETAVTASAWFLAATSGRSVNVGLDFYDITGTQIGGTLRGPNVTDNTTTWVLASATITVPTGGMFCRVNLQVVGTGAANEDHYTDDVIITGLPELSYAAVGRANDDTTLANDVQITNVGGTQQEASNAASIRKYLFPRTYNRSDIILQSDFEALAYAQWVLIVSLAGEERFDTLIIDPLADPTNLFPQVLGREIGDRIQVWRRPQNSDSVIVKDCFIRGITHSLDVAVGTWQTQWDLQDASKYTGFLILDDTKLGTVSTTNKLAF